MNQQPIPIKRRSEEELEKIKVETNEVRYGLCEQEDFKGDENTLKIMQSFERAYMDGYPLVSDEEWELLKNKYNYKESLIAKAPSGRNWIKLQSPLPSLDKLGSIEDLNNWLKNQGEKEWLIEPKLDGLTANIIYKLNNEGFYEFYTITSRGNGFYGLELNPYALSGVITNIPQRIAIVEISSLIKRKNKELGFNFNTLPDYLELRGEAVIPKIKETEEKYGKDAVLRSIASGMFNRKCPSNIVGALAYIFEENSNITLDQLLEKYGEDGKITLKSSNARLIASLQPESNPDPYKFLRNDYLTIDKAYYNQFGDYYIRVLIHHQLEGHVYQFNPTNEYLDIVFYSISIGDNNLSIDSSINGIKTISDIKSANVNNITFNYSKHTNNIYDIKNFVCEFYGCDKNGNRDYKLPRFRNECEYALDGVVIKPVKSTRKTQGMYTRNHKNNINKIVTPKYPEDQIAIKLLSEIVKVKLDHIEYKDTSLGNKTCTGILDKPYLTESGAIVEKINLHNINWLQENDWIKEGEEYSMVMMMDIIPQLLHPDLAKMINK